MGPLLDDGPAGAAFLGNVESDFGHVDVNHRRRWFGVRLSSSIEVGLHLSGEGITFCGCCGNAIGVGLSLRSAGIEGRQSFGLFLRHALLKWGE